MSKLYTYYPEFDDVNGVVWLVFEKLTNQIIEVFWFEDDAAEYSEFLEKGGGFFGFTPSFVLKKTQLNDINTAFESQFFGE